MRKESIVLIRMADTGKSTIGLGLAKALAFNFTDLDKCIRNMDGHPLTEALAIRTIALPFYNNLREEEIDYVVGYLKELL